MVIRILTYALVSTWSSVSSGWEHVMRKMHPCIWKINLFIIIRIYMHVKDEDDQPWPERTQGHILAFSEFSVLRCSSEILTKGEPCTGFPTSCPAFASRLRCICEERRCIFFSVALYLHWSAQMQFIRCPHLCRRPCSAPRQRLGFHINRQAPSPGQIRRLKEPHIRNSHSLQRPASADFSFGGIWKKKVEDEDEEDWDDIQVTETYLTFLFT